MSSRRGVLARLATLGAAVASGCASLLTGDDRRVRLPDNPHDVPDRQHAWNATLRTDASGNRLSPRHHRVLLLELDVEPSVEAAETVERAMRELEAAYEWGPRGLLHALAWGTGYFERTGTLGAAPIRKPRVLSRVDDPDLLAFDAALVLASDVPSHLVRAEAALFADRGRLGGQPLDHRLGDVFSVDERRTGFVGEGLPAEHASAEGVPDAIPEDAPMFTGFFSGRRGTQATEDRVTIPDGRFAGGTTMHLSHLTESLSDWWAQSDEERVARMFSAELSPEDVAQLGDDVSVEGSVAEHASEHGVVGHQEKVARVREGGRPVILRRDFNTLAGDEPGLQFLSLQRSLADFARTRKAMNGWYLRDDHPSIRDQDNNGLLDFVDVRSRANFYVPPRDRRAFPLL